MPILVLDPPPAELEALLVRRRSAGADVHDEVWEGVYRMTPAPRDVHALVQHQLLVLLDEPARAAGLIPSAEFNLGEDGDYRVPDGGLHRSASWGVYASTAVLVLEVLSPGDQAWEKIAFFAAHGVQELLYVDPDAREVHWLSLVDGRYEPVQRSSLIEIGPAELRERIAWPPGDAG